MFRRFKTWNMWRKQSLNGPFYKILVLFGLAVSPTYEMHFKWREN